MGSVSNVQLHERINSMKAFKACLDGGSIPPSSTNKSTNLNVSADVKASMDQQVLRSTLINGAAFGFDRHEYGRLENRQS